MLGSNQVSTPLFPIRKIFPLVVVSGRSFDIGKGTAVNVKKQYTQKISGIWFIYSNFHGDDICKTIDNLFIFCKKIPVCSLSSIQTGYPPFILWNKIEIGLVKGIQNPG